MRTTVTLDDDLARRLRRIAAERGISFKSALNEAIRGGLDRSPEPQRFRVRSKRMGPARIDITKGLQIASRMEDEEIVAKLRRAK